MKHNPFELIRMAQDKEVGAPSSGEETVTKFDKLWAVVEFVLVISGVELLTNLLTLSASGAMPTTFELYVTGLKVILVAFYAYGRVRNINIPEDRDEP